MVFWVLDFSQEFPTSGLSHTAGSRHRCIPPQLRIESHFFLSKLFTPTSTRLGHLPFAFAPQVDHTWFGRSKPRRQ